MQVAPPAPIRHTHLRVTHATFFDRFGDKWDFLKSVEAQRQKNFEKQNASS